MPLTTYYADAATLNDATAMYLNSTLTEIAPDGYYSDGTISRYQLDGLLQPAVTCPTCGSSAVLTFMKYTVNDTNTLYDFSLFPSLLTDVTVDMLRVDVYDEPTCGTGGPYVYNDTCSGSTISAGTNYTTAIGDGLPVGTTCADAGTYFYHTVNSIVVNGTTVSDGDIISIGGINVTINLQTYTSCRAIEAICP
jgi:hypothetical protein